MARSSESARIGDEESDGRAKDSGFLGPRPEAEALGMTERASIVEANRDMLGGS
jgi:hypothetical protein